MAEPNLSVIVLAWNQVEATQRCVDAIRRNTAGAYELILVDNGSDPTLDTLLSDVGDTYIRNDDNLGFAPGMNCGLAAASAPYVVFLNNDTIVPDRWTEPLLESLSDERVGIVVPAVTAAGNPVSVRTAPGTERIVVPRFRALPSAVAYAMRRAVIEDLGGWDERYVPATAEDLDLLWSVWVNGLDVVIDERVLIDHIGSATIRNDLPRAGPILRSNRQVFAERWAGEDPQPPDLGRLDPDSFAANLEVARVAAHWMQRAFSSEDRADATARELAKHSSEDSVERKRDWLRFLRG